jgi:DNA-directed RNA polymerase subunit RPC12/RpoP
MNATCTNCGTTFRNADRNEDGVPEIPEQVLCAHPECETALCPAGCRELSFTCAACSQRFCDAHPAFALDGEIFCAECFLASQPGCAEYPEAA